MRVIVSVALIGAMVSVCFADVVYLRNGKSYEGEAKRDGDKVRIKMKLGTIVVAADQVVHIARGKTKPKEPETKPGIDDPAPAERTPADVGRLKLTFDISEVSMPESPGFILMRKDGSVFQIDQYRQMAHDRRRRVGSRWLTPEDFVRRRGAYEKHRKEGEEYARKATSIYGKTGKARMERVKYEQMALARFRMAARAWPDPVTKDFLLGVTELNAGREARAEAFFRKCCEEAPRVAAFHQGRGKALRALKRPLEAVAAFTEAARLSGATRGEVLQDLQDAMNEVKGALTDKPDYVAARELLKDLGLDKPAAEKTTVRPSAYGSTYTRWLLPTGKKTARAKSPPDLDFDRLYFKQGIGLPVGKHALLVDASVVEGASELFVRIDEKTVIPAQSQRMRSTRPGGKPMALVQVTKYVFTPVETVTGEEKRPTYGYNPRPSTQPATDEAPKIFKGMEAKAYGLSVFEEMGSQMRTADVDVKSYDPNGGLEISGQLAAGEAAGPVLTHDGKLLCFLAGRTDIRAEQGGPHKVIPLSELVPQIRRGQRSTGTYVYGAAKNAATQPAPGRMFIVYGTFAEAFKSE